MKVVTNKVGRQFFKLTVTLLRNSSSESTNRRNCRLFRFHDRLKSWIVRIKGYDYCPDYPKGHHHSEGRIFSVSTKFLLSLLQKTFFCNSPSSLIRTKDTKSETQIRLLLVCSLNVRRLLRVVFIQWRHHSFALIHPKVKHDFQLANKEKSFVNVYMIQNCLPFLTIVHV